MTDKIGNMEEIKGIPEGSIAFPNTFLGIQTFLDKKAFHLQLYYNIYLQVIGLQ